MVIKGITLRAFGSSPTASFGILTRIITDSIARDPDKDLTVTSSVENRFAVNVPAGTSAECTQINMQVMDRYVKR